MKYVIYGKYQGSHAEYIDEFNELNESNRMLNEYRMAFGAGWTLWIVEKEE